MSPRISASPAFRPVLDPEFIPASLWNRAYRAALRKTGREGGPQGLAIALERSDGSVSVCQTAILPHEGGNVAINHRYVDACSSFSSGRRADTAVHFAHRCIDFGPSR